MKESIKYLRDKLTKLFVAHPYLEIRYEYKNIVNSHIIEVKPIHCFNSDRQYILKQIEIENAFEDNFYGEEIVFITEDSLVKIVTPILSLGVTSINVNLSKFVQQKTIAATPKICFEQTCVVMPYDDFFQVACDPPTKYENINNSEPKDSKLLSESFLF